jgi:tRNA-U20-dihydrouridine synthase
MLDITRRVVDAVSVPVTVKTRWDGTRAAHHHHTGRTAAGLRHPGTYHPRRTRSQMYTGQADWTLIGEVKRNPRIHIPIIGNGDITTPEEARRAFELYGVDAVMIGRATFGRPWIFKEIRDSLSPTLSNGEGVMSLDDKIDILKEQLQINVAHIRAERGDDDPRNELRAILHTRRHLAASPIFKGIPNFRQMRIQMLRAETVSELNALLEQCRELLKDSGVG